ncbi:MAG: hypothetical protein GY950_17490 [bacterium]|nr:hypothetical protein [bacterium]
MRRFSSYGPIDTDSHYFAARKKLIDRAYTQLVGENPVKGGHYITTWAPRQAGKTWVMQEVMQKIRKENKYEIGIFSIESAKKVKDEKEVIEVFTQKIAQAFRREFPSIEKIREIPTLFTKQYFQKPVILIVDEFDSLEEDFINGFAGVFRDIFVGRTNEKNRTGMDKTHLLHGLALVGVRSVLGIENVKGSPFNVQRSLHIPNLSLDETTQMFRWYEKESGQTVDNTVIETLQDETRGQPGLTCWFGELLTETYNQEKDKPISMDNFEEAYAAATYVLPNNNILNLISKVKPSPYKEWVLELFKTDKKIEFKFDDEDINYLYMNGIIDQEKVGRTEYYVKFSCPFVQKRLFNYFSGKIFNYMGQLVEPFENLDDTVSESGVNLRNLLKCYGRYLDRNRDWLLKDVPRRKDLRIYEAVHHFNLYMYLFEFFKSRGGRVYPEFPTGNGKIDIVVHYNERVYGLELKSFTHEAAYKNSLRQAAGYGKQLKLKEIALVFFVESISDEIRDIYEKDYPDAATGVTVTPVFIETGR